ncbi:L,D-transpeptidase family protein [Moritella sp. 24]|uniref:L,D-transpeptidase family protein n=1 Tax=Moritella sp. 24 TaxID=2746230 RepID=UPI001BA8BF82|nr:L,D-transpeptidase family protein [Moritella sp. 24]QUM76508.1 L,D-transpeptidase family protein [Moritella sp. 24]
MLSFFKRLTIILLLLTETVYSKSYPLPETNSRLIGHRTQHKVVVGDYFHSISKSYNIGMIALMASNPSVDPFLPPPDTILELPTYMLLPDAEYKGIVINLPELRLYYFPNNSDEVHVFPVGIGREGRKTPKMNSFIKTKLKDPVWTPTAKTRAEYLEKHKTVLPQIVQAGEHNPLGNFALQLAYGKSNYLIHGTNQNFGIGMRISAGCIRMNPEDIEWLYNNVTVNEPVKIINNSIKLALEPNGQLLLEVHSPLSSETPDKEVDSVDIMNQFSDRSRIDKNAVKEALLFHTGLPIDVTI